MRIGINALYLIPGGVGGTEIYLRNLLKALSEIDRKNRYFVFTNAETEAEFVPVAPNFIRVPQNVHASNRPWRLLWEQTALPLVVHQLHLDCLLNPGFTAPVLSSCNVTVFHDLQHKRYPEHFRWFDLPFWNIFLWLAVKRSSILLADSEATRDDLRRYYPWLKREIVVAPLGVESEFFSIAENRQITGFFLLCVSTLHPHKNLIRLLRVFARLHRERPNLKLTIAGLRGFQAQELEDLIAELRLEGAVTLTGWIPRSDLYDLFRRAHAFVYPSTFEGFGLPVVEAMAAGVPMACSSVEPLRTIAADAAILFDPHDEDAMQAALVRLLEDDELRAELVERGRKRAHAFRWEESARITLHALTAACLNRRDRIASV